MKDFFYMGGYAFYVWGSYLVTLLALGSEVVFLLKRRKAALAERRQHQSFRSR